jgi:hypothetical protein
VEEQKVSEEVKVDVKQEDGGAEKTEEEKKQD